MNYTIPFVSPLKSTVAFLGMPSLSLKFFRQLSSFLKLMFSLERHEVNILDARKLDDVTFEDTGVTLVEMEAVQDWDSEKQLEQYKKNTEEAVKKLYAKNPPRKMMWLMDFLKRGGSTGNPPATDGPHLDYYQDWSATMQFRDGCTPPSSDTPDVVLGIWRPCMMNSPVYDYPLVFMDAATYKHEHQVRFEQEFKHTLADGTVTPVKNLAAHTHYDANQRWLYYSEVAMNETLIFTHFTKEKFKANIHCAVKQPLPEGKDTRQSLENRLMLWFKN